MTSRRQDDSRNRDWEIDNGIRTNGEGWTVDKDTGCPIDPFKMKILQSLLSLFITRNVFLVAANRRSTSHWETSYNSYARRNQKPKRITTTTSTSPAVNDADWVRDPCGKDNDAILVDRQAYYTQEDTAAEALPARVEPSFHEQRSTTRPKAWPPWPFNLLTAPSQGSSSSTSYDEPRYRSGASIIWTFSKQSVRIGYKNVQTVGNQLWFHLPPAAVPFMMVASIPQKQRVIDAAGEVACKRVIPLVANPFARNLALSGLGLAIVSWGHYSVHRKKLQPLPLVPQFSSINRAILPPFLPEQVSVLEQVKQAQEEASVSSNQTTVGLSSTESGNMLPPKMREQWTSFLEGAPKPTSLGTTIREWRRMREHRLRERQNAHRLSVMDELIALQTLKKDMALRRQQQQQRNGKGNGKSSRYRNPSEAKVAASPADELGYALVTGASRGIGRAIAVELARWEIPLILVARDIERLTSLAYDIETCYGVKCCVLRADLSERDAAEQIYKTTQKAGLKVDILVNNAGFALHGLAVDQPLEQVNKMLQVNALSLSSLTHLFGRDMKNRGRGRIMMVSSICGTVAGLPTVAAYAATKAFENVLGVSMSKEMEPYGVGVFCLMPGAVKGTDFKSGSETDNALCWKIPFYAKTPPQVAKVGVRNMLRGDTQFVVGWQNRLFVKVLKPTLPQRLHDIVAEIAFNPVRLPFPGKSKVITDEPRKQQPSSTPLSTHPTYLPSMKPSYGFNPPPKLLELERTPPLDKEPPQEQSGLSTDDSILSETETKQGSSKDTSGVNAEQSPSQVDTSQPESVQESTGTGLGKTRTESSETTTTTSTKNLPALAPADP